MAHYLVNGQAGVLPNARLQSGLLDSVHALASLTGNEIVSSSGSEAVECRRRRREQRQIAFLVLSRDRLSSHR